MTALAMPLSVVGDVSDAFVADLAEAMSRVPAGVLAYLARHGITIMAAPRVIDVRPEWMGEPPRGWPPGQTWAHVDGTYDWETRTIIIPEWFDDPRAGNRRTHAYRHQDAVLHEMGHAFDEAEAPHRSASLAFQTAYQAGLARLAVGCPPELEYERQAGEAGAQEAFAEAFALMHGGKTYATSPVLYEQYFPEVLEHVREAIAVESQAVAV